METLRQTLAAIVAASGSAPDYVLPLTKIATAAALALLVHALVYRALVRSAGPSEGMGASLVRRARRPLRLAVLLLALILVLPTVALPPGWPEGLGHLARILLITLVGWTLIVLVNHFTDRAVRRHRIDTEDNLTARKFVTQARVLRRTVTILIGLLTAGAVLLTFESVQRYGVSLFASAGAAGLVVGLAARPVLANLIAGIQIALTQPIRLEDVVIVDDEWGWIEDITATYVVVRLWDWRRMIVPLSHFIETPFQNWTRDSASIIGTVTWSLDYTVPVDAVRAKLEEIVRASKLWDGRVVNLQVVESDRDVVTLRGLMSARTSPQAWDLRCAVREAMIAWLQTDHPGALPRQRGEIVLPGDGEGLSPSLREDRRPTSAERRPRRA